MANAKHIGCMWALAVALGMGVAVANTPAVASAAPGDSGSGSSSGESSSSSSSGRSGSKSSDTPSAKHALSATNDDAPGHRRRPLNLPGKTAETSPTEQAATLATPEAADTDVRHRGGATFSDQRGPASQMF
jgi:hypothetical protein